MWLVVIRVSLIDRRYGDLRGVYTAEWGQGWYTLYVERVAFKQDRSYTTCGALSVPIPTSERTAGFATDPIWTCAVYTQHLPCSAKSYVPSGLQGKVMGLQLLLPEKSCKFIWTLCYQSFEQKIIESWTSWETI